MQWCSRGHVQWAGGGCLKSVRERVQSGCSRALALALGVGGRERGMPDQEDTVCGLARARGVVVGSVVVSCGRHCSVQVVRRRQAADRQDRQVVCWPRSSLALCVRPVDRGLWRAGFGKRRSATSPPSSPKHREVDYIHYALDVYLYLFVLQ